MSVRWIYFVLAWLLLATREGYAVYMPDFEPDTDLGSTAIPDTDEIAEEVPLDPAFPFYNREYSSIYVNDDGILTFGAPLPGTLPGAVALPIGDENFSNDADTDKERLVAISPFWSEVNTADSTGTVYYRVGLSRNSQALLTAESMVKACYIDQESFTATSAAVFTWDQVSDVPEDDGDVQENSFQAILVYSAYRSFVIFYYSKLTYLSQEVAGTTQVGFNAGDVSGGLSLLFPDGKYSRLLDRTNCAAAEVSGAYVFRVDTEVMTSPGCSINQKYYALQVSPSSGPMMGGNKIRLAPSCSLSSSAICVFVQGEAILQVVRDQEVVGPVLVCIPGPFFVTGDVSIRVYIAYNDDTTPQQALYTHKYTVEHPDDSEVTVTRVSATSSAWKTAGSQLTISWVPSLLEAPFTGPPTPAPGADNLQISILQYDESAAGQEPTWQDVYTLGTDVTNSGTFSFTPVPLENITQDNPWGMIRVQRMDEYPAALYSDVHMLGYLLHEEYQNDPVQWADTECRRWDAEQDASNGNDGLPSYLANVPACPCTLQQAEMDPSHFLEQRGGCALSASAQSCTRQGGSSQRRCFLSIDSMRGAECCYDTTNNNLVFSMDDRTGGSSDKAAVLGVPPYGLPGSVPFFSHWAVDVMPYQLCCRWGDAETCRLYLEDRWPKGCSEYAQRESALIFGDPHFVTFDQRRYTFNGIGEYRIIEVTGVEFMLFGRTMAATNTMDNGAWVASYLNAVVMQDSGSDVVHVEVGQLRDLNLYVNSGDDFTQPNLFLVDNVYAPLFLKGVTVYVNPQFSRITVAFHTSKVVVDVSAWPSTQSIAAEVIVLKSDFPTSAVVNGLLGDLDGDATNDIRELDGSPYTGEDPEQIFNIVKEWDTTPQSRPVFHMDSIKKRADYQNATFVPTLVTPDPSTLDPTIAQRLELTCQGLAECIYDMSVTESVVAGEDCYNENANYEILRRSLEKIETCPYIPSPANGEVKYSNDTRKYGVGTTVTFSCTDTKFILIGPATRSCTADSESIAAWSDTTMPACTETECDTADLSGADVISTNYDKGFLEVVCSCPGSNSQFTASCRTGGVWEGLVACSVDPGAISGGAIAGIVIGVLVVVALIVLVVVFLMKRRDFGTRDLERSGTKVNAPSAENWGMDEEAKNAAASLGGHASTV